MKIPKTIFGKQVEGAIERALKKEQETPPTPKTKAPNKEGFIHIPEINLYVSKGRTHLNKNFHETQEALHNNNEKMLTPDEWIAFIKHLKGDYQNINKEEADKILDDILAIRKPARIEWLDHEYKKDGKQLSVIYHKFNNGNIEPLKESLDTNTLMIDKEPGIDLEDYLNNHTKQGLPYTNTKEGKLWHWHPKENRVAGFVASSDRLGLDCSWIPQGSYSSLGVRVAKFSTGNQG